MGPAGTVCFDTSPSLVSVPPSPPLNPPPSPPPLPPPSPPIKQAPSPPPAARIQANAFFHGPGTSDAGLFPTGADDNSAGPIHPPGSSVFSFFNNAVYTSYSVNSNGILVAGNSSFSSHACSVS